MKSEFKRKTASILHRILPRLKYLCFFIYRQLTYHAKIEKVCNSSRLQIIAAPLTVVYEEGSLSDTTFGVNFLLKLTMSMGRLSMKEAIVAPPGSPHASNNIDMITFTDSGSSDFKLIYEVTVYYLLHMTITY